MFESQSCMNFCESQIFYRNSEDLSDLDINGKGKLYGIYTQPISHLNNLEKAW